MSALHHTLLTVGILSLSNCAQLAENARQSREQRPPANDTLTGGTMLLTSAIRSTVLSTLRQPITTTKLGVKVFWHRPREIVAANIPIDIQITPPPQEIPGTAAFEAVLDDAGLPAPENGRLTWLVGGDEFFPELDRQLASASRNIDLQVYIFDNDDIAVRYAEKLKARSSEVRVRVLFDDIGSAFAHTSPPETPAPAGFVPPPDMVDFLKQDSDVGVRRLLNPWLVADHSKLLVFDDRTAIIGGMNIGREYYSEWQDLMVKVEGPVVGSLAADFNRTWRRAGPWGDLALFRTPWKPAPLPPVAGQFPMRILRTDPAVARYEILNSTLLAIRAARSRIWIESPYVANEEVRRALESAAQRGVDVRLILPENGDSVIMDAANLTTARQIILAGGRVYVYPRMTHMKVMIADNWASVGSANLDTLSLRINRELNLSFNHPREIRQLENRVFLPDFRTSRLMRLEETESLVAPLTKILADQL